VCIFYIPAASNLSRISSVVRRNLFNYKKTDPRARYASFLAARQKATSCHEFQQVVSQSLRCGPTRLGIPIESFWCWGGGGHGADILMRCPISRSQITLMRFVLEEVFGISLRIVVRNVHLPHPAAHHPRFLIARLRCINLIGGAVVHLVRSLDANFWYKLFVISLGCFTNHNTAHEQAFNSFVVRRRVVV
jgi:hypothetical protein